MSLLDLNERPFAYLLDAQRVPYPVSMDTYISTIKEQDVKEAMRRVDRTQVGEWDVSTVFLFHDHNYGPEGPPILFETMIFPENECWRYATWQEAEEGHARVVAALERGVLPINIDSEAAGETQENV